MNIIMINFEFNISDFLIMKLNSLIIIFNSGDFITNLLINNIKYSICYILYGTNFHLFLLILTMILIFLILLKLNFSTKVYFLIQLFKNKFNLIYLY